MQFLTEPEPTRGFALPVLPGIRRIVARNPGPMTYRGTNTYLIDSPRGTIVVDPGPDDAQHVADVLAAAGAVVGVLLTHAHRDHVGAAPALRAATGAPLYAWHAPADPAAEPDVSLHDGDDALGWKAVYTPGHAPDHVCFAGPGGVLLSGDHVMSWSTSVIAAPGGSMAAYFGSLERLLGREDAIYLPGHGPPLPEPKPFVAGLLAHRVARERAIRGALDEGPATVGTLTDRLYPGVGQALRRAAERNVTAHLQKLQAEGAVRQTKDGWQAA